ncbi:hypothetical protein AMATHDRAFT_900 [Amanita thiersii Skay4041]|uniref:PWWP domain-containing protein n=1 Tax=Amanita thiersii Skay4041 TaxID=703135 RepID=A0A2A9P035_9AGAR|nr:hypothetical protein AMATHDRAFT_900 [Amanita thiersii Skay4041]
MSKKASKAPKEVSSYTPREIVLGKVRGYPPWPGMVVDSEAVPAHVAKERPTNKKAHFYCVRFFPTGEFAWLVAKDISKLQTHEIQSYINEPYKKSGDLLQGYRIALDPLGWEQEIDARMQQAAEEEPGTEVDELLSENDDGDSTKAKSRKRKRVSDAGTTKSKKGARSKKESGELTKKRPSVASARSKRNGTKSKAMVESEDEGDAADAEDDDGEKVKPSKKVSSPPPTKKARRDKEGDEIDEAQLSKDPEAIKVREWRHKLQKSFLSNKGAPKDEEMPLLDDLFTTVESYDRINIQYLSFSKIGKVMRHIAALTSDKIPRDDEFKFRERAKALVDKWHQILNANKPNGAESVAPAANGSPAKATEGMKGAEPTKEKEQSAAAEQHKDQEAKKDQKEEEPVSGAQAADQPMETDTAEANEEAAKDAPGSPVSPNEAGAPTTEEVTMDDA